MNPHDYLKNEILKKYSNHNVLGEYDDYNYSDFNNGWITTTPSKSITMDDVLDKFTPEQLIEAIGVDEVQNILRNKKLNILKKKLNK